MSKQISEFSETLLKSNLEIELCATLSINNLELRLKSMTDNSLYEQSRVLRFSKLCIPSTDLIFLFDTEICSTSLASSRLISPSPSLSNFATSAALKLASGMSMASHTFCVMEIFTVFSFALSVIVTTAVRGSGPKFCATWKPSLS